MGNARSHAIWQKNSPTVVTVVIVALAVVFLYWASPVLIPTALAILLAFLLGPVVLFLQRHHVPRAVAVLCVVGLAGVLISIIIWLFLAQTVSLINDLPKYQATVSKRIEEVRGDQKESLFQKVQKFADRVVHAATGSKQQVSARSERPQPVVVVNSRGTIFESILFALQPLIEPIAMGGLVAILLIYLLIELRDVRDRLLRLVGRTRIPLTTMALDDASRRISRYLLAQFIINMCFGLFIGVGLALIRVPYAPLWGIMSAFIRYIPIAGPWLSAILPVSLSFLTASGWTQPILAILLFAVFEMVANLWVEPWIYGQTMGVSQSSLLIAIAFWTWLWGPMGLVLAAPMTVCLMILGRYVPALKFFDILLGDEPPLTADLRFYQRLLAHNHDEASEIAHEQLASLSLEQVYDQIIMRSLSLARRDMDSGRLGAQEAEQVWESCSEIAEELALAAAQEADSQESPSAIDSSSADINSAADSPPLRVLLCAARDAGDEAALGLLRRVLNPKVCVVESASADRLAAEIVSQAEHAHPSVVCIASLPPGGIAHTRLLCKRLRRQLPDLKILVGRWGQQENLDGNRDELVSAGADLIGTTLEETNSQLAQLAQFIRPSYVEHLEMSEKSR